jgi:hypothetical protein
MSSEDRRWLPDGARIGADDRDLVQVFAPRWWQMHRWWRWFRSKQKWHVTVFVGGKSRRYRVIHIN